ncbi:hypothetical protein [Streptomyces sp. NPDC056190]|uniref:hypothetical protein n=1 Tax=Streptomyces sp. NPDC056190 TaxID=3345741 RepID=UPI0035D6FEE1
MPDEIGIHDRHHISRAETSSARAICGGAAVSIPSSVYSAKPSATRQAAALPRAAGTSGPSSTSRW